MKETTAAQALPALLTFVDADLSGIFRIVSLGNRSVVNQSVPYTRGLLRQHFLKRDAVFFDVLVYSG
jgi:hypothetical protein